MSEIVYYDANPTVRSLMTQQFGKYGLDVVILPDLENCEDVFKTCKHPVAFVADMSRKPELLTMLLNVVPKYIDDSERCILTSIRLKSLAPYLPDNVDDCFFKHFVERPFKRLEFIAFFESIIRPYIQSGVSVNQDVASCMNSSVEQVNHAPAENKVDDKFAEQVENIVSTASGCISIENMEESLDPSGDLSNSSAEVDKSPEVQRCANRMSRRNRSAFDNAFAGKRNDSSEVSRQRHREQPRFTHESSSPSREISTVDKKSPADAFSRTNLPGRPRLGTSTPSPAPRAISAIANPGQDAALPPANKLASAPEKLPELKLPSLKLPSAAVPPIDKIAAAGSGAQKTVTPFKKLTNPYIKHDEISASSPLSDCAPALGTALVDAVNPPNDSFPNPLLAPIESAQNMPERDEECTLLVSPALMCGSIEPVDNSPSIVKPVEEAFMTVTLDVTSLKTILELSMLRCQLFTLVSKGNGGHLVIFVHSGRINWIEYIAEQNIMESADFLAVQPEGDQIPMNALLSLIRQNISLSQALAQLGFVNVSLSICQRLIQQNIVYLNTFEGQMIEVYHDVPTQWMPLSMHRPLHDVDIFPYLFEELRENAEFLLVPDFYQYSRFAARSWRNAQNISISLNDEEKDMLASIKEPRSIVELRAMGKKSVAEILYRLVTFNLADFVMM